VLIGGGGGISKGEIGEFLRGIMKKRLGVDGKG
jgi:hypothetical protein